MAFSNWLRNPWFYFVLSLVLLALAFALEDGRGIALREPDRQLTLLRHEVRTLERDLLIALEDLKPDEICHENLDIQDVGTANRLVNVAIFHADIPVFWSSNQIDPNVFPVISSMKVRAFQAVNGIYLFAQRNFGDSRVIVYKLVYQDFAIQNSYLRNGFDASLGEGLTGVVSITPAKGFSLIEDVEHEPLFYVLLQHNSRGLHAIWHIMLWVLGFAGLAVFVLFYSLKVLQREYFWQGFLLISLVLVAIRLIMMVFRFPALLYDEELFGPSIYASSHLAPSLGDLFLNVLTVFVVIYQGLKYFSVQSTDRLIPNYVRNSPFFMNTVIAIILILLLATTAILIGILQSLLKDSSISFNVSDLLSLSSYSLIALLISALLFFTHYTLLHISSRWVSALGISEMRFWSIHFLSIGVFCLVLYILSDINLWEILLTVSYFTALLLAHRWLADYKPISQIAWLVLIISVFASSVFYRYSADKELSMRYSFAQKISTPKDVNVERLLREVETSLVTDSFITKYFVSPFLLKSQLEEHVKKNYFSGYLSAYELQLQDFDTAGNPYREASRYSFSKLQEVYDRYSSSTLSRYFYQVNYPAEAIRYMARIDVCDSLSSYGHLYILLKPRIAAADNFFGEITSELPSRAGSLQQGYSFAIYDSGSLVTQSTRGYAYPVNFRFARPENAFQVQDSDGYNHMVVWLEDERYVVVSQKSDEWLRPVSIFSYIFIIYSLLALLVIGMGAFSAWLGRINIVQSGRFGYFKRKSTTSGPFLLDLRRAFTHFATRIQFSFFILVFLALLLSGVLTVRYISLRNQERQRDKMAMRIRMIVNAIENERDFERKLNFDDELNATLTQIAETHGADLTLFGQDGRVLSSTRPRIFTAGITSSLIHPDAYRQLKYLGSSLVVNRETIGNLDYLSFYVPVFNTERRLLGYLNLPYFSNEAELKEEIASFLANFIILYVLFFGFSAFLAYFLSQRVTRPLQLIRENMAATSLSRRNEPIQYEGDDEIGQLVQQYNRMIDKLADSADALARSEREGAWKEMARQIAHEIKNPLTPMKLSIQHLQRAWKDKSERLPETFEKVTQVLIEQIEGLNTLASEFSSFAKMPEAHPEIFKVSEVIEGVIALYSPLEGGQINYLQDKQDVQVFMDREQLGRVITNLIKNAIEAVELDGNACINVSLEAKDEQAWITVQDNGCGIAADQSKMIFSPSFSTKSSGMGIGLSISLAIVERAGGNISFYSEGRGKGAIFTVKLPLALGETKGN